MAGGIDTEVLDWVLGRVHRHILRFGHRLTASDGRLDDLFVSLGEARGLLAGGVGAGVSIIHDAPPEPSEPPPSPGLDRLAEAFALDPLARRLLLLAAGPGLDHDIARMYTFAWADFTHKQSTAGFLAELVSDARAGQAAALAALRPDAPLVRHRLVRLHAGEHWRADPPLLQRAVTVPEAVMAALRGEPPLVDEALAGAVRFEWPAAGPALQLAPRAGARIAGAWARAVAELQPVLLLTGPSASGRRSVIAAACAARAMPLVTVDAGAIPPELLGEALADVTRDARAAGAAVLVRGDVPLDATETTPAFVAALAGAWRRTPVPLAVTAARSAALGGLGDVVEVDLPVLPHADQVAAWRHALVGEDDPGRAVRLAGRFSMPIGAIHAAAAETRRRAAIEGVEPDDVAYGDALRRRVHHALDAVAEPVHTTLTWADVVLPDDIREALEEIRAQARHRSRVFDEWGFRRKMSYGRGLACLFSGPPGTGKTMMAGILANDLGRALYRVDLSRVVSKWVGETEKNLARVFDEAERAQVILFFDEADSLFSTRTEVKGANDRFANMEVNYLLQRMEQFDGMSILTTNFERSLDEAFKRRLRFRLHFPLPEAEQRTELWQRMVPAEMPTEDGIRWDHFGKKYKIAGGNIKNAVLRAAFYAAEGDGILTFDLLDKAAEAERRELGRL